MIELSINQPYPLPTPSCEGASANFLNKNGNVLQINISNLTDGELLALKKGKIKAGFIYERGDLLWLFQFSDKRGPVFTLDAPFDARRIPHDLVALHDITNERQRLAIDIHVIDRGTLRALRVVTMPPKLTVQFLSAAQEQLSTLQSGTALSFWMSKPADTLARETALYELGK